MKANELRIGNLIIWNGDLYKVEASFFDQYSESEIEFVPLTEEWLVRFGFYKNIDTELFEKGGYQIDLSVLKCHFYLPDFGDWYKELEYVHQLQNLYFALTGEELTLSE